LTNIDVNQFFTLTLQVTKC